MKVLSIEQMNKLKELGVDVSNASVRVGQMVFYHGDSWYGVDSYNVHLLKDDDDDTSCFEEEYKAFTLQDIIDMLPNTLPHQFLSPTLRITKNSVDYVDYSFFENVFIEHSEYDEKENILDAAYNMLLWVIEKGYLKTK